MEIVSNMLYDHLTGQYGDYHLMICLPHQSGLHPGGEEGNGEGN